MLEVTGKSGLGVILRVPVLYGPTQEGNKESAVNTLMDSLTKAQTEKVSHGAGIACTCQA